MVAEWRSGESTRLSPMWPGFDSWTRGHNKKLCGLTLLLMFFFLCCWFSFFSAYSGFPSSTKTNILKFQFDLETVDERATRWKPLKFPFILACRTGVIFCVFQASEGKREVNAKCETRATGGAPLPSRVSRTSRSPRACPRSPGKRKKIAPVL